MPAELTEKEFSQHLDTIFQAAMPEGNPLELKLVAVKGYLSTPNEQSGMERFSAIFEIATPTIYPQNVYALSHERMGEFEVFLVPISTGPAGTRYEAVFNYFKER